MLRLGFLPSDFNPMLLMLGEAEDLRAFARVLRRIAHDGQAVRLEQLDFCRASWTSVTLVRGPAPHGLYSAQPAKPQEFIWRLDAAHAAAFADQADDLAAPTRPAGSELLQCSAAEQIVVKLSRGEYTDDFLLPEAT